MKVLRFLHFPARRKRATPAYIAAVPCPYMRVKRGPKGLNSKARLAGPGIVVRQNGGLTAPHLAHRPHSQNKKLTDVIKKFWTNLTGINIS
jgi:hypothetical protein